LPVQAFDRRQLYRALNQLMIPLFSIVARTHSATVNTVEEACNNHKACVEMIPETPLARVEHRFEQYYGGLR
jgi:hypothetical protein